MQDEERDRMLNIGEAAAILGVHKNTLRSWAEKGLVPHVKLPSGYRRFRLSTLRRFARSMEQGGNAPAEAGGLSSAYAKDASSGAAEGKARAAA